MGDIAYYRVSTPRQGESGLGLEAQVAIIKHYYPALIDSYTEVESGRSTANRPELEKAIKLCQRGNHTLVVAKVDRLSRSTEDTLRIYRRLGGRLKACDLPLSNGDESGFKFALTLYVAIAERESDMISIRTKAAMEIAKKRGTKMGTPENLTDVARERSAAVQRAAAKDFYKDQYHYIKLMRDNGLSYNHIARQLNEEGKQTRNGKPYHAATVYRILQRGNGE
jgi:DNA invertase Pin-like site-specific DNA recombinase